jgi:hypothetical protein
MDSNLRFPKRSAPLLIKPSPTTVVSRRHQNRAATVFIGTMRKHSASGASRKLLATTAIRVMSKATIAEQHLAKERRPIECREGADAADGEGHHHAKGKGEARSDETQAVVHSLHGEPVAKGPVKHWVASNGC